MKDLLFSRTIKNKCPICDKKVDKDYIVVNYGEARLKLCKKHLKYSNRETNDEKEENKK